MGNETTEADKELEQLEQQLLEAEEKEKAQAAQTPSPEPEPVASSPAPEPVQPEPEVQVVTPPSEPAKAEDDSLKWAEAKGLKTMEDMARALKQKEQEFHKRNQAGHPGYQDLNGNGNPPPPQYQPRPDMNGNGYQMPPAYYPPPPVDMNRQVAQMYGLDPEDARRIMPLVLDTAKMIVSQERAQWEQKFGAIERSTQRSNELLNLSQDPAFRNPMVQKEIHEVLDANPSLFNGKTPYADAFNQALANMARKQLQQGAIPEHKSPKPPVTAGGGNGSAFTNNKMTQAVFEKLPLDKQEAYLKTNGAFDSRL